MFIDEKHNIKQAGDHMDYNNIELPFDYISITKNDTYSATEFLAFCMLTALQIY